MKSNFALIIPTIGIPELFEALDSIAKKKVQPDQVIIIIDDKGRALSPLSGSLEELEAEIRKHLPEAEILHNTHDEDWQMNNQTFNIGIEHARHDYVYVTHDDVIYPDCEYFEMVGATIEKLGQKFSKRVVGAVFPALHTEINITAPNFGEIGLTPYYSAVSSLLSVDFWRECGKFDVTHGIWWDAQMQGEFWRQDCWMYYEPIPPVLHYMNRALRANGHAQGWTKAPLWQDCASAYEKVFGKPHILWGEWYNRPDQFIVLE